jgi:hypothetical protein
MGYVFDRLAEAGGRAILAMARSADMKIALMLPALDVQAEAGDDALTPIHPDTEVSMFFEYLLRRRKLVIERGTAELVPHSGLALSPS